MPRVEYDGKQYDVPEGLSDEDMLSLLKSASQTGVEMPKPSEFPVVSPQVQQERDREAAKIRAEEVGNDPARIDAQIRDIERALSQRPSDPTRRQILQRELSFWKTAKETLE